MISFRKEIAEILDCERIKNKKTLRQWKNYILLKKLAMKVKRDQRLSMIVDLRQCFWKNFTHM